MVALTLLYQVSHVVYPVLAHTFWFRMSVKDISFPQFQKKEGGFVLKLLEWVKK